MLVNKVAQYIGSRNNKTIRNTRYELISKLLYIHIHISKATSSKIIKYHMVL